MAKMAKKKPVKKPTAPTSDQAAPADATQSPASSPPPAKRKTFCSFKAATVRRSAIQLHQGNPRTIDRSARRRLRETIQRNGLVEPLCCNHWTTENGFTPEQAGTVSLVGGHQRLSVMDEIRGYPDAPDSDYDVPVSLIEVTLGREKELVVSLNNPTMQGQWDIDLLEQLIASPGVEPLATGFDRRDLGLLFDQGVLDEVFGAEAAEQAAAERPVIDELVRIGESSRAAEKQQRVTNQSSPTSHPQPTDTPETVASLEQQQAADAKSDAVLTPEQQRAADVAGMKERRRDYVAKSRDANDAEFMLVLVADSGAELDGFMQQLGLPTDNRYLALSDFQDALAGT